MDLATVMARFLALGMDLRDVLYRATAAPARCIGLLDAGARHLRVGGVADVCVLRTVEREHRFVDRNGARLQKSCSLAVEHTIQSGNSFLAAPGRSPGAINRETTAPDAPDPRPTSAYSARVEMVLLDEVQRVVSIGGL